MRRSDTVLDVRAIRQAALRLGPDVWVEAIDGARHDVFMSDADARVRAIATLDAWLEQVSGPALTMKPIGGAPGREAPRRPPRRKDSDELDVPSASRPCRC